MAIKVKTFNSEAFCGYKQISTFYEDFGIAEYFGVDEIKDTYETAFKTWKDNVEMITELCMVLNWKSWEHADGIVASGDLCKLYIDLYYKLRNWCIDNLKGEDLTYFLRTTD